VASLFDELPQRFTSSDIRETFGVFDQKWADRHARDWQEALTKTDKAATAEVKRVFFDGTERNFDVAAKRIIFFHYWMSRALPLYTEALARDPLMLYNYGKLLQAMQDDSDLSGSKFFKWFSTPMGYNTLIRPDAFLSTFANFWEDAGYTPDGENLLGKMLRRSPVMVNPIIQSVVNMLGMQGDTFLPDPIGANKFIQFYQATIDNANAQFGWDLNPGSDTPLGNYQESLLNWARSQITETLDWAPGVDPVPYNDTMAYKENEVRSIIADIALERGLNVDDALVQESMVDPESDLYQEAMKRYALQDAADITLRILPVSAVLYPKSQLASPKQRTLDIAGERQQQQNLGTMSQTPASTDLYTERDTINASDEYSRNMQQWEDEYKQIGEPEERAAFRFFNNIRYGGLETSITVSGQRYTPDQVAAMDDTQRKSLAETWATESGNAERVESLRMEREAFREEHSEYAEFSSWSAQLNDYEGGPQQWAKDAAAGNPNYARWYNGLTPEQQQDDMVLTSLDAYMSFSGNQMSYFDDAPVDTRTAVDPTPYNPIGDTDTSGESGTSGGTQQDKGPTQESIVQQIQQYETDMAAYNASASTMLGQQVNVDLINPMARNAVVSNLETLGIYRPRMGGQLYDYMQWAQMKGEGDTSISAYLSWYATQNPPTTPTTPGQ
jgi:hypothetical protein